jgi:hypothetical protein
VTFDPTQPQLVPCERCGRRVVDGSTDFGNGLLLRPVCGGIQVEINDYSGSTPDRRVLAGVTTRDELQAFLDRAYGPSDTAQKAPGSK